MADNEKWVTEEELKKLKDRLSYLKTVVRKQDAEALKQARSYGDLSENSEYDEAKNDQAKHEAEIRDLEYTVKNAKVIDESVMKAGVIRHGSKVEIKDEKGATFIYTIVSSEDSDPLRGRISEDSPVGKALIGKKKGSKVEVETPGGILNFTITATNA